MLMKKPGHSAESNIHTQNILNNFEETFLVSNIPGPKKNSTEENIIFVTLSTSRSLGTKTGKMQQFNLQLVS